MKTILLVLIATLGLHATAITSAQTGDWNQTATWTGGVVPGDGDTVTIANGHTVTIPTGVSVTVGDSANPTTNAIRTAGTGGTGILVVAAGATLTLHGYVLQGNATWTVGSVSGGAAVVFDHASTKLIWQIADANSQANAVLKTYGAAGNRSTFSKSAGGVVGGGFKGSGFTNAGRIEASYTDFSNIGDNTAADANPFLSTRPASSTAQVIFDHSSLTSCGKILFSNQITADAVFRLSYVKISSPNALNNRSIQISGAIPALTTGTRLIEHSYIEGTLYWPPSSGSGDLTISDSVLAGLTTAEPLYNATRGTLTNVLLWNRESTSIDSRIPSGIQSRIISLRAGNASADHFRLLATGDATYDGVWFETSSTGDDYFVIGDPTALSNVTLKHCVVAPSSAQGTLMISIASAYTNLLMGLERCTLQTNGVNTNRLNGTENGSATAGAVTATRDSLEWRSASGAGVLLQHDGTGSPASGAYTNADYNATYNITPNAASDLYKPAGFAAYASPNPPGAHDFIADPAFVDSTRNFLKWGQSINSGLTTWAQVVAEVAKMADDSGWDARFNVSDAFTWLMSGFAPRNVTAYGSAAHDGSYVGGVQPVLMFGAMNQ